MSVCLFLASDRPLQPCCTQQLYAAEAPFVSGCPGKPHRMELQWHSSDGAGAALTYIRGALLATDSVELWLLWLSDYIDYDERPKILYYDAAIGDLNRDDLIRFSNETIWADPHDLRPHWHCLRITKE